MNPADSESLKQAFTGQAAVVKQHETTLLQIMDHVQQLTANVAQLGGQLTEMRGRLASSPEPSGHQPPPDDHASPAQHPWEPFIPIPARYNGDLGTCAQFLHQCSLVFSQQPHTYASHQSKISFVMSLLTGQAAAWALAVSDQYLGGRTDFREFAEDMRRTFDHSVRGRQAVGHLLDLQQGADSVSQYAVQFRILAAESGWGESALQAIFVKGLASELKDELALREESSTLNHLIELAIRLDNRIRERSREKQESRRRRFPADNPPTAPGMSPALRSSAPEQRPSLHRTTAEEPMQLGRTRLSPAERQRRMQGKLCLYCGHEGHYVSHCPEVPKGQARQGTGGPW